MCDGVYKQHTGEGKVKEQLQTQRALPSYPCWPCSQWLSSKGSSLAQSGRMEQESSCVVQDPAEKLPRPHAAGTRPHHQATLGLSLAEVDDGEP